MTSQCFKLGHFVFCLESKDRELLACLGGLLAENNLLGQADSDAEIVQIDLNREIDNGIKFQPNRQNISLLLDYLIGLGLKHHKGLVWLDAACLIDNYQQAVLIAGQSNTGKSTISLALAKTMNWKIVSEDITFIDGKNQSIIPFARPLSLRKNAKEILFTATKNKLTNLLDDEWYFESQSYSYQAAKAKFAYAILLEPFAADQSLPLTKTEISWQSYLTKVLAVSNAVRLPDAIRTLNDSLQLSRCLTFKNGLLVQRLEELQNIAAEVAGQDKAPGESSQV